MRIGSVKGSMNSINKDRFQRICYLLSISPMLDHILVVALYILFSLLINYSTICSGKATGSFVSVIDLHTISL